jgi:HAD superfamily hydrolase (TIGR01509 family)
VRLVPGVVDFLEGLSQAGIPVAVATSASAHRAIEMLERFQLSGRFRAVVTGSEVANGKPHPEIFHLAADRLGQSPDSLAAFEDAVSGVHSATAAGMACVGIGKGHRATLLLAAGAKLICENFVGLSPAILEECCSSHAPL